MFAQVDRVGVRVYALERSHEEEALAVFRAAYPGKTIVPVVSDDIIALAGAVHCPTMTIAAE